MGFGNINPTSVNSEHRGWATALNTFDVPIMFTGAGLYTIGDPINWTAAIKPAYTTYLDLWDHNDGTTNIPNNPLTTSTSGSLMMPDKDIKYTYNARWNDHYIMGFGIFPEKYTNPAINPGNLIFCDATYDYSDSTLASYVNHSLLIPGFNPTGNV
jgi:hypothetical protein